MKAIAAMAQNRAIGKNNGLPWPPIKEDFKWFKEFTLNQNLVMGRLTHCGMPSFHLKNRNIFVLSKTVKEEFIPMGENTSVNFINDVSKLPSDVIVAGGSSIYKEFLPHITEFYVTHVYGEYDADTFMPPFEHLYKNKETIKKFDNCEIVRYS